MHIDVLIFNIKMTCFISYLVFSGQRRSPWIWVV